MDAVSGAILNVDNACAHFTAVDELEHCGQKDGALESRPDEGPMKARYNGNGSQPALRRSRDHSTEVSSS
jgi:hypothetical protein